MVEVACRETLSTRRRLSQLIHLSKDSSYNLPALSKPLRPIWVTPSSSSFPSLSEDTPFYPIICLTASKFDSYNGRTGYVQGSGDDHEMWGMVRGQYLVPNPHPLLTPVFFRDSLRRCSGYTKQLCWQLVVMISPTKSKA